MATIYVLKGFKVAWMVLHFASIHSKMYLKECLAEQYRDYYTWTPGGVNHGFDILTLRKLMCATQ